MISSTLHATHRRGKRFAGANAYRTLGGYRLILQTKRLIFSKSFCDRMVKFLDLKKINSSFEPGLSISVQRVIDSGIFIRGKEVEEFQTAYLNFTGTHYCTGVGNGFDALQLIFRAWIQGGFMQPGDEVIVPANTYIASVLAVAHCGLKPVLVDPDPGSFNITAAGIAGKISSRTRAILLVHLYGRNSFSAEIAKLAADHGLKIAEDNAQAAGCRWRGARTGSLGNAAAHSFFPTKNLGALGDGGAVTTDDADVNEVIRTLGNYGSHQRGENPLRGINSRLDELQAAALRVKLSRLDADNETRRSIARRYLSEIENRSVALPERPPADEEHVWHLFVIRCRKRDALVRHMHAQGIEVMVHYPVPPHKQAAFRELNDLRLPETENIHREVMSLPLHPALGFEEVERVIRAVNNFRK